MALASGSRMRRLRRGRDWSGRQRQGVERGVQRSDRPDPGRLLREDRHHPLVASLRARRERRVIASTSEESRGSEADAPVGRDPSSLGMTPRLHSAPGGGVRANHRPRQERCAFTRFRRNSPCSPSSNAAPGIRCHVCFGRVVGHRRGHGSTLEAMQCPCKDGATRQPAARRSASVRRCRTPASSECWRLRRIRPRKTRTSSPSHDSSERTSVLPSRGCS